LIGVSKTDFGNRNHFQRNLPLKDLLVTRMNL
jgi:hypothetical protein